MESRTTNASIWTIAGFGSSQLLRLFSNLILTRLLLPEAFGLMAIVTVVRSGVYMCSEIGLKVNIIRHERGEDPDILNTAWTMQVIRGVILWVIIAFIAWGLTLFNQWGWFPEESVYSDQQLPALLLATGVVAIITGFESSKSWLAQRNLLLGRLTLLDLFSQAFGLVVMVWGAWVYESVWALVAGSIVSAGSKTVLSHVFLVGAKNYFYLNKKIVIEFLHFGKWLFLSAIITFFALSGDRLILGGVLTAEELGFYTVAYFLAISLKGLVSRLITNVWYPLLSQRNRENKELLIGTYYQIRLKLDPIVYLLTGVLFATAPLIIEVLYDDRYRDAGWMLQILAISIIPATFSLGNALLLSMGHPKVGTIAVAIRAAALFIMVPMGFEYFGMEGAIWAIAVNPLFEIVVILWFFSKYRLISWFKEIMFLPCLALGYYAASSLVGIFYG
jgi:O-antigen/teichoic acid export membrane protein